MNTEVLYIRISVLVDSFDPVRTGQIDACISLLSSGMADRVLLLLSRDRRPCASLPEDRWKMLCTACAANKALVPFRIPPTDDAAGTDDILRRLQKKFPEDSFSFFSASGAGTTPCPSVQEYCELKGLYHSVPRFSMASPWIDALFEALNPHRFAHSLSVARTAARLARLYDIDVVCAEEAGLLHDCAKCLSLKEMQKIARKHHLTEDPGFLASGALLHSVVGAWVARKKYGMEDPEILQAIAYHNTGCAGMSRLAMCVCLADYIEPNREPFPGLEDVRFLAEVSLEKALLLSLENVADHVLSGGKPLHSRTSGAIRWLKSLPEINSAPVRAGGASVKNINV